MADRLRITELDFDTIKNNLKLFLKQQSEFTDYDFEGSGLNVLLDILAYNTHYQAYYLNMVANEAFLDTALLRDSVVSHAKTLGYTPYSKKSPTAIVDFIVNSSNNNDGTLTLPRGFGFLSNQIDGKSYKFIVLEDTTVTKANSTYYFDNLEIREGQLTSYSYVHDESANPKQFFILPDENIDVETLKVAISPSTTSTELTTYNKVSDIIDVGATSEVYYIQEHRSGKYEIYFGNDVVGKKLPDGAVVYVNYLITNATAANKANNFVATAVVTDSLNESLSNFIITPVSAATGGSDRETVDEIKFGATAQFSSQNRLVTIKDYESYIRKNYPSVDSVSIWGGEDEVPKVFGKVFVSMKPKNNYYISEAEKQRIINEILGPKSIVSISTEIRDPEYLYILVKTEVLFDQKKTSLSREEMKTLVKNSIMLYRNSYLNSFKASLIISRLQEQIDKSDVSIIGNSCVLKMQKRFIPVLDKFTSYTVNFNNTIHRGTTTLNRLTSTQFKTYDTSGILRTCIFEETPQAFTGISKILINNAGYGYTSTPTVTITGDGTGAEAVAVVVNGKIEQINITKSGINYSRAIVTIDGNGYGAEAVAEIDAKSGTLRTVYFDSLSERKIINENAGSISYDSGVVYINDINIVEVISDDGMIRLTAESQDNIIESIRNTILTIDDADSSSIDISLTQV